VSGIALALLSALAVGMGMQPAAAAERELRRDAPIEITADRIVYEHARQVYVAEGSVRVVQEGRRIDADWIVFNRLTRRGIAAGNVRAVDGEDVLEARFIEFDNTAQQGLVLTGRLDLGEEDFRVAAGELLKTGPDRYAGEDVSMTTCRCPDDQDRLPWVINADEADVEIGGYATVTNSTVDVLGVPTVWLPWAAFPVKTERATGFLPPELRYGGGLGFEVALPFFWAATDQVNVTLTPRYMSERGFKPEVRIETVYGQESSTEIFGSFLRDQDPERFSIVTDTPNPDPPPSPNLFQKKNQYHPDRWAAGFDNDVHAPGGLRLRSDIQLMSDNEYVRDFDEFRDLRQERFVESTAFGFRHFGSDGSAAGVVSAVYRDDRQNPDRADRDKYVLQRAPGARLAWLPTRLEEVAGLELGMGVDYAHFYAWKRADTVLRLTPTSGGIVGKDRFLDIGIASLGNDPFTDPDQRQKLGVDDQRFQEGEPLDNAGHRVILNPHLGHSFRLFDVLDVRPEAGWQQTLYATEAQSFEERGLLTGRLDLQSQLRGSLDLPGLPPMVHLLEPRAGWAYIWKARQSDNPLFVPATRVPQARIRQLSLDNRVLDDADRIDPANVVTLGFGNHFYTESDAGHRLFAELDFSAAYDFRGGGNFGLAIAEGRMLPWKGVVTSFGFAYDLDKTRVDQAAFDVSVPLHELPGLLGSSRLYLGYRYRQAVGLFFESFDQITGVDDVGGTFNRFKSEFTRINQFTGGTRLRLSERWAVEYQFGYSLHRNTLLTNRGALEYTSKCRCWAIQALVDDHRTRGLRYGLNFTFLGFGMDREQPFREGGMFGTGFL
jgi:lipopolysaccharide assembly outer membrane protein LptD (OstA)